jgi:hypothetical protein
MAIARYAITSRRECLRLAVGDFRQISLFTKPFNIRGCIITANGLIPEVLYAIFYGGIRVQRRQKYRLKVNIDAYKYWVSGKV